MSECQLDDEDQLYEMACNLLHDMNVFFSRYEKLKPRGSPLDVHAGMILKMAKRFEATLASANKA